jgi:hypothetical protein
VAQAGPHEIAAPRGRRRQADLAQRRLGRGSGGCRPGPAGAAARPGPRRTRAEARAVVAVEAPHPVQSPRRRRRSAGGGRTPPRARRRRTRRRQGKHSGPCRRRRTGSCPSRWRAPGRSRRAAHHVMPCSVMAKTVWIEVD